MKKGLPVSLNLLLPAVLFSVVLLSAPAQAHEIAGSTGGGFFSGLLHPVLGLDHFLAMVSVGLLSAQIGGRAIWTIPTTFVLVMLVGGILGMAGIPFLSVELGIAFSVFALGFAIAADKYVPILSSTIFVGIFALFHGHAHGAEMPIVAQPALYALGFIAGTASIHVLGVLIGLVADKLPDGPMLVRFIGAGIAGIGLHLLIS